MQGQYMPNTTTKYVSSTSKSEWETHVNLEIDVLPESLAFRTIPHRQHSLSQPDGSPQ
jgi:hypothetical protein